MKIIVLSSLLLLMSAYSFAIRVKFTVTNMSVNVAEGSIGVFISFQLYRDNFVQQDSLDFMELIDFSGINYDDDIREVVIEKTIV